ncbi:MAG: 4-alpha-glucanotransferase (amylomaltase) [Ktedonobacterales bacterium]|jgi:4-alpha-glucanotransferase|nr:MAG: 4-alpha-glucanotransferase (amylomaltase) [Ktedonobacterales bacterium]
MEWPRASGILVHPTSFPGQFGIGDLGLGAVRVFDFLSAARQKLWQILPLGPTGYGDSPYALLSAFAGNPLLISPEHLIEAGLLTADDLVSLPTFPTDHVDFASVIPAKLALLRTSFAYFEASSCQSMRKRFDAFLAEQHEWLDDYALFMALKAAHNQVAWTKWPTKYRQRDPEALAEARTTLAREVVFHQYCQFLFFAQWEVVRQAAHERGISIVGDLAIFVAHDSADVWAHPDYFHLDDAGLPVVVAGVPPDYFSVTGQRWGNPIYRWDRLAETGYAWWIARVRQALKMMDIIRLDHFRGFEACWQIPGTAKTAVTGHWVKGPGISLFHAIHKALGEVPFIAEDLGVITPEVRDLQHALGFPGMHILQFAFGSDANNPDLPHNYSRDSVVYTGTHDNNTTRGWFETQPSETQGHILRYLKSTPNTVVQAMIRAALSSVANLVILPLQDVLELESEARMNFPSHADGNWQWRCTDDQLASKCAEELADLAHLFGR